MLHVHSLDGLDHSILGVGIVPYLIEERIDDLRLKDTCFISELPKPEGYIINAGCEIRKVIRLILTYDHSNQMR
jgi:hypothetical protein